MVCSYSIVQPIQISLTRCRYLVKLSSARRMAQNPTLVEHIEFGPVVPKRLVASPGFGGSGSHCRTHIRLHIRAKFARSRSTPVDRVNMPPAIAPRAAGHQHLFPLPATEPAHARTVQKEEDPSCSDV